jgi:hypothetical protein
MPLFFHNRHTRLMNIQNVLNQLNNQMQVRTDTMNPHLSRNHHLIIRIFAIVNSCVTNEENTL